MGVKISQITRAAKGQECTIRIPGTCNGNPETTVFCHAPSSVKGVGNKSHDYWGAFGCSDCHRAMDEFHVHDPWQFWFHAIRRTWDKLIEMKIITIPAPDRLKRSYKEKVCTAHRGPKGKKKIPSRPFPKQQSKLGGLK